MVDLARAPGRARADRRRRLPKRGGKALPSVTPDFSHQEAIGRLQRYSSTPAVLQPGPVRHRASDVAPGAATGRRSQTGGSAARHDGALRRSDEIQRCSSLERLPAHRRSKGTEPPRFLLHVPCRVRYRADVGELGQRRGSLGQRRWPGTWRGPPGRPRVRDGMPNRGRRALRRDGRSGCQGAVCPSPEKGRE